MYLSTQTKDSSNTPQRIKRIRLLLKRFLKLLFKDKHIKIRLGKFKCLLHKTACPGVAGAPKQSSLLREHLKA